MLHVGQPTREEEILAEMGADHNKLLMQCREKCVLSILFDVVYYKIYQ
jgi:hypothetical protein